jgi:hypothetical protein
MSDGDEIDFGDLVDRAVRRRLGPARPTVSPEEGEQLMTIQRVTAESSPHSVPRDLLSDIRQSESPEAAYRHAEIARILTLAVSPDRG